MKSCETCIHDAAQHAGEATTVCLPCFAYVNWADRRVNRGARAIAREEEESATSTQIGGDHYAKMKIQPFLYIHTNDIGFGEGCVIKYVSRWRTKNGIEDLRKARHFLDMLIEAESAR
jgi:hypothetical protein